MVTDSYDHIWDCCCDHGFLGAALLQRQAAPNVHFVDIVPALVDKVESNLQRFYPDSPSTWFTHCLDVAELPLDEFSGKHLIIIAGVGGDLMTLFIESIHQRHPDKEIEFLLCPVHHQFTLRSKLIELDYRMKDEVLVEDNQRFYEVILIGLDKQDSGPVHQVGEKIWQSELEEVQLVANRYLNMTLNHYQRIQSGKTQDVQHIIHAYAKVNTGNLT